AHHIILTDEELKTFDTNFKVTPPLRSTSDTKAILKGLKDGTIDMITSDHNPIDIENKKVELENAFYGTIGLESLFGSVNTVLGLEQTILCLTENPQKRFGITSTKIAKGEKANLTLFNPDATYTFSEENILSKSKNSSFLGKKLKGFAYGVIAKNKMILR
ncbi:MAG: amidohydrolase family protein, partial [Flavobacteriaceae bacterium]|nr:amidohydrolase family protein [Flavobacteriaceae bacterium]